MQWDEVLFRKINNFSWEITTIKKCPNLGEAYEIIFKTTLERNPGYSKQFCTIP